MKAWRKTLLTLGALSAMCGPAQAQLGSALRSLLGGSSAEPVPAADFSGKKVSLTLDNEPLSAAFKQLRDQTGIQFSLAPAGPSAAENVKVTLNVKDKPLWEAVRALLAQTGQSQPMTWTMGDATQNRYQVTGFVSSSGPFLINTSRISHVADYTQPADQVESLQLQAQLYCDPSVHVNTLPQLVVPTRAVDDKGNSLIPAKMPPDSRSGYGMNGLFGAPVIILLRNPGAAIGQKITTLDGSFPATFLFTQDIEVPMGKSVEKKFPAYSATIEVTADAARSTALGGPRFATPPTPAGGAAPSYTYVIMRLTRNNNTPVTGNDLFSMASQAQSQMLLLDDKGNPWRRNSTSTSGPDSNTRVMVSRFVNVPNGPQATGDAVKAVMQLPISSADTSVPYHFENIPLP